MTDTLKPENADQFLEVVKWAVGEKSPLEIRAGGTKQGLGRSMDDIQVLDLSALKGITYYEAPELVLSAQAATPMNEIHATLAHKNQQLAFEPPDIGPLLGTSSEAATLGGVLACNLAGPRRIQAGAAREHGQPGAADGGDVPAGRQRGRPDGLGSARGDLDAAHPLDEDPGP